MKLHWQIAIALVLAAIVGIVVGPQPWLLEVCGFVGTLFLNALKMIIVPLIAAAIISGLVNITEGASVGRMGLGTLLFYLGTGLVAILTGLLFVNLLQPGLIDGQPAGPRMGLVQDAAAVLGEVKDKSSTDLWGVILRLIPVNPVGAAAQGDVLGLVSFCLLFGVAATLLPAEAKRTQQTFWLGVYEVMTRITGWVMKFAPIGVFGLVSAVVAKTGFSALRPLALFFFTVLAGLVFHSVVTLPIVLKFIARVSPLAHARAMAPAILTAFSSSSSAATLPITVDCIENRVGISRRVSGFVLPIGANVNTDGSALYECVAAMFIAQAYGVHLGLSEQFVIVAMALFTAIGVAGIPSASLVALGLILTAVGVPLEGLGLILAVDRLLDMCRTAENVWGDSCAAVVVARLEGEELFKAEIASPALAPSDPNRV